MGTETYPNDSKALFSQDIPLLSNDQVEPICSNLSQTRYRKDAHQLSCHVVSYGTRAENHSLGDPSVHDQSSLPRFEGCLILANDVVKLGNQSLSDKALHDAALVVFVQNSSNGFRKGCALSNIGGLDSDVDQ